MREVYLGQEQSLAWQKGTRETFAERTQSREKSEDDPSRIRCYSECMNDAWDLKSGSFCSSVCAYS